MPSILKKRLKLFNTTNKQTNQKNKNKINQTNTLKVISYKDLGFDFVFDTLSKRGQLISKSNPDAVITLVKSLQRSLSILLSIQVLKRRKKKEKRKRKKKKEKKKKKKEEKKKKKRKRNTKE